MHEWVSGKLRSKSWHGREQETSSGYIVNGETPTQAMIDCNIFNTKVVKIPVEYEYKGKRYTSDNSYHLIIDGVPGKDEPIYLKRGVTYYEPLQNSELAKIHDPLSKDLQLEAVAMVGKNAQITFIQFSLGEYKIGNDEHKSFLLVGDDKTNGGTHHLLTNTNVVCMNTWRAAINGIDPIPHSTDSTLILRYLSKLQQKTIEAHKEQVEMLNQMFTRKLKPGQVNAVIERVFPYPKKSKKLRLLEDGGKVDDEKLMDDIQQSHNKENKTYETNIERVEKRRTGLAKTYVAYKNKGSAETVYTLFNSATYYINHSDDFNGKDTVGLLSAFFGTKGELQDTAWKECVGLMK